MLPPAALGGLLIGLMAVAGGVLFPAPAGAEIVDRVVMRVNDRIATLLEYEQRRDEAIAELRAQQEELSAEELSRRLEDLGNRVFRKMFEDLLLLSRADQIRAFPNEEQVDQAVTRIRQGFGIQNDDEFAAALSQQGMSLAEFREQVRGQLRIRQVIAQEVTAEIELEEDDLRRVYRAERDAFITPQRWRVREFIVLDGEQSAPEELLELAEGIHEEVVAGRSIDEVAAQYAEEGLTSDVVDHGWVEPGELSPALEAALESLGPGEVSGPVDARGGYHILEVQEYEESRTLPFSEVEDRIEQRERRRLFAEKFEEYMRDLEEDAYVVADPPPGAAGFRTVAGDREDVDPYAGFESVSAEDEEAAEKEGEPADRPVDEPEIEIEPSRESGPPPV